MTPIEIMEIPCTSTEELIQSLKDGVEFVPTGRQNIIYNPEIMYWNSVPEKQLEIKEKVSKLKSDIITLNLYQFFSQDILSFGEKEILSVYPIGNTCFLHQIIFFNRYCQKNSSSADILGSSQTKELAES